MSVTSVDDPRFLAALEMLKRTGAREVQIRYQDELEPVVWMVVAGYARDDRTVFEAAAALSPLPAALRLCETVIDGGTCTHCSRPTGFHDDFDSMPLDELVCWYQWDPELETFRRGCEGSR